MLQSNLAGAVFVHHRDWIRSSSFHYIGLNHSEVGAHWQCKIMIYNYSRITQPPRVSDFASCGPSP